MQSWSAGWTPVRYRRSAARQMRSIRPWETPSSRPGTSGPYAVTDERSRGTRQRAIRGRFRLAIHSMGSMRTAGLARAGPGYPGSAPTRERVDLEARLVRLRRALAEALQARGRERLELAREQGHAALEPPEVARAGHRQAVDERPGDALERAGGAAPQPLHPAPRPVLHPAPLLGDALREAHPLERDADGDALAGEAPARGGVLHPAEDLVEQVRALRHATPPRGGRAPRRSRPAA